MSTPTEAYYDLRRHVIFSDPDDGAELIADSEANAVAAAVTALTCIHHNDLERAACPVCLVTALTAERDQLRARAELAEDNLAALEQCHDDNCRGVVRIADELAVERARLDWLESPAGMDWQWQAGITRATIDAKMQKDAK